MNVIDNTGCFSKFLGIRFIPIFPREEKEFKTGLSGRFALDKDTQLNLISEIKKLIESGIDNNADICAELDDLGLMPEIDGVRIKNESIGKYITKARKQSKFARKQVKTEVVVLFEKGKEVKDIAFELRTTKAYVKQILCELGLVNRVRRNDKTYRKVA